MMFETLGEVIPYLESHIDYERARQYEYAQMRPDVAFHLAELVGSPQTSFRCVHIAGTKGKGSTTTFTQALLKNCGVNTGAYISPHIFSPLERIQVGCSNIDEKSFCRAISRIADVENRVGSPITYFEILTVASLLCHKEAGVEIAAYEVGIGGRLDATQVVNSIVSVITNISYDHMDKLGTTLSQIAVEKCGIIRRGVPVVSAPQTEEAQTVIIQKSAEIDAPLILLGRDVQFEGTRRNFSVSVGNTRFENLSTNLLGNFQVVNAACAIAAVYLLHKSGFVLRLTDEDVRKGIEEASIPGRMQVLMSSPVVIADGSHNGESVSAALRALKEEFAPRNIFVVFGCALDKDVVRMARAMAQEGVKSVFVVSGFSNRSIPADELADSLIRFGGLDAKPCSSVSEGLDAALASASSEDAVISLGSFYSIPYVVQHLKHLFPNR